MTGHNFLLLYRGMCNSYPFLKENASLLLEGNTVIKKGGINYLTAVLDKLNLPTDVAGLIESASDVNQNTSQLT